MRACLVCGKNSPAKTVLCEHCGAPLPDERPPGDGEAAASPLTAEGPGPRKRSRTGLVVGALAVLAIALVVGIYWWQSRSGGSARALAGELPAGLTLVGGFNAQAIFEHEWFKKLLDAPGVSAGLRSVRSEWGIDVLGLRSGAGGVAVIDGDIHMLMVARGTFDKVTLNEKLGEMAPSRIPVGEHHLMELPIPPSILFAMGQGRSPFGQDDEALDEDTPSGRASLGEAQARPMPLFADVVFGAIDDQTFVMGSPTLIGRFLEGDTSIRDDESLGPLMEQVDDGALGWGVGSFTADTAQAWWTMAPLIDGTGVYEELEGATFLYEVRLDTAFTARLQTTLATDETAIKFETGLREGVSSFDQLNLAMTLMGAAPVEPQIAREGRVVTLTVVIPLPEIPTL